MELRQTRSPRSGGRGCREEGCDQRRLQLGEGSRVRPAEAKGRRPSWAQVPTVTERVSTWAGDPAAAPAPRLPPLQPLHLGRSRLTSSLL